MARLRPGREESFVLEEIRGSETPSPVLPPWSSSSSLRRRKVGSVQRRDRLDVGFVEGRVDPSRWSTGKASGYFLNRSLFPPLLLTSNTRAGDSGDQSRCLAGVPRTGGPATASRPDHAQPAARALHKPYRIRIVPIVRISDHSSA